MGEWPEKVDLGKTASTQFLVPDFDKSRAILEGVDFFNFGEPARLGKPRPSLAPAQGKEGPSPATPPSTRVPYLTKTPS